MRIFCEPCDQKGKTAEEYFQLLKTMFDGFCLDFLADYCTCRILLINLFKSLYQAVEKRNFTLPCDFQYIYELYHKIDETLEKSEKDQKTMKDHLSEICDTHGRHGDKL